MYTEALRLVPHKFFTFGKLWVLAAKFELRQMELGRARKLLGQAIGMAPKARYSAVTRSSGPDMSS